MRRRDLFFALGAQALCYAADRKFAYRVNCVGEHEGLPRGTVDSFAVEAGGLRLLGTAPLALSAVYPSALAVSPDGRYVAVAVTGGGAYNVLRVEADGRLGAVTGIVKLVNQARPETVWFEAAGKTLVGRDARSGEVQRMDFAAGEIYLCK